jgi:hypothetical protein
MAIETKTAQLGLSKTTSAAAGRAEANPVAKLAMMFSRNRRGDSG